MAPTRIGDLERPAAGENDVPGAVRLAVIETDAVPVDDPHVEAVGIGGIRPRPQEEHLAVRTRRLDIKLHRGVGESVQRESPRELHRAVGRQIQR